MTDFFSTEPRLPVSFQNAAVYARHSTVMQLPSSIDDQLRSCQEYADQVGWTILHNHVYIDSAKSGTTTNDFCRACSNHR